MSPRVPVASEDARDPRPLLAQPFRQLLGAVTIDGDKVVRNPGYYVVAHASKFVRPGSVRIHSSELTGLPNRRMFDTALSGRLENMRRYGWRFGLLIVDIDRFPYPFQCLFDVL